MNRYLKTCRKIGVMLLGAVAWLALSSCMLNRVAIASFEPQLTVDPAFFCPGESVTLSWRLPTREPCYIGRPSAGITNQCSHVLSIDPSDLVGTFRFDAESTNGSRTITPPGTTTFTMNALVYTGSATGTTEISQTATQIDGTEGDVTVTIPGGCGVYNAVDLTEVLSACVQITQVCLPADAQRGTYTIVGTSSITGATYDIAALSTDSARCGTVTVPDQMSRLSVVFRPTVRSPAVPRTDCTTSGTGLLPDLNLGLTLGCNSALEGCNIGGMGGGVDPEPSAPPPTAPPSGAQAQPTVAPTTASDACAQYNSTTAWINPEFCSCQGSTYTVTQCVNGQPILVPNANSSCTPDPAQCQPQPSTDSGSTTGGDTGGGEPTQGPTCEFKCYVADPNKPEQCQQGGWVYPGTDTPCNPNNP